MKREFDTESNKDVIEFLMETGVLSILTTNDISGTVVGDYIRENNSEEEVEPLLSTNLLYQINEDKISEIIMQACYDALKKTNFEQFIFAKKVMVRLTEKEQAKLIKHLELE